MKRIFLFEEFKKETLLKNIDVYDKFFKQYELHTNY